LSLEHLGKLWRRMAPRLPRAALLGFSTGCLGLLISPFHFALSLEENTGLGLLFKLRGARPAPSEVVVVSIDKESAEELGVPDNPDKWPRSLHAGLTELLVRNGAEVIAFDVHFVEARTEKDDNLFAGAMMKAGKVVLCEPLKAREVSLNSGAAPAGVHNIVKIVPPIPLLAEAAVATAPFVLPRIPFKVNQYWTFQTGAGDAPTIPAVAFQLFTMPLYEDFLDLLAKAAPERARELPLDRAAVEIKGVKRLIRDLRGIFESEPSLEGKMLEALGRSSSISPDGRNHRLLRSLIRMYGGTANRYLNYFGPPRTVATIPYHQALQLGNDENADLRQLAGKVVFVGLSEKVLADRKDSFYTVYSQANGLFVSGVEIMATAFDNILQDDAVKPVSLKLYVLVVLSWGMLLGISCRLPSIRIGALSALALSAGYLALATYSFKSSNTWFPIMIPLFFQAPFAFLGAVAVEHSRLFKEVLIKMRMEKDLSFARDIQMSMLPAACPKIPGYQIAASSTPAQEVSGDFFDFIEIDEQRLGFVIADVTGKSVSGALVMAASKSVFRILSEEQSDVGQIMIQANRRIKMDVTKAKGMFVALLYAVLDTEARSLSLCSAGQTQPIYYSSRTGKASLVETEGDAFPLGILDDPDYQETQFSLAPGDILVFYTDGVVEANDKNGNMYGFDHFVMMVENNHALDADSLLERMIDDVAKFVGKVTEQHDDLTIVVVKVE
jgi:serine phosphatase RsbU (regulator of sigma subunit)/CHASE2 domain-containing sensor protein